MRLRIILAFHKALIYYTQDFRVYEETRDQPMPGPFPAPPIFLGKSPGDEVDDILEPKHAFLGYKNKKFKKSKNWHFFEGVNPWFCSNNGHMCNNSFLVNIGQENVFYDILERKTAFLGYKNKKFKKSKNWHFFKRINPWF